MDKQEKIKQLYKEGKIKPLGNNCYSVSSKCFVLGITPKMIKDVLKGNRQESQDAEELNQHFGVTE